MRLCRCGLRAPAAIVQSLVEMHMRAQLLPCKGHCITAQPLLVTSLQYNEVVVLAMHAC